ncbi:MAG: thioredoxin family protein [Bacteroidales bacterium]|jgi:peroxiredoxin
MKALISMLVLTFAISFLHAEGYQPGDKAKGFNLKNVDGKMVSNSDYQDAKGFIVIFTCNHCPYSVAYQDRIIALNNKYAALGYPVIAINPNDSSIVQSDSYSNMQIRAKEKGFDFPYLLDADQSLAHTYGATRTPHVFILQKDSNELIVRYIGAIDDNYEEPEKVKTRFVEQAVDALLEDRLPEPNFTKAIGCTIKFS